MRVIMKKDDIEKLRIMGGLKLKNERVEGLRNLEEGKQKTQKEKSGG